MIDFLSRIAVAVIVLLLAFYDFLVRVFWNLL